MDVFGGFLEDRGPVSVMWPQCGAHQEILYGPLEVQSKPEGIDDNVQQAERNEAGEHGAGLGPKAGVFIRRSALLSHG